LHSNSLYLNLLGVKSQRRKISALVSKLLEWFSKNARDLPWRRTNDPYCVYVSEIMLQQTQVKTVVPYWERWMRELPTIQSLAKASPDKIHKLWEGLGYYPRVRNLQKAAQFIEQTPGGIFPAKFDDVLALPGVGRYTAGAICSIAFNQPTPILDGNVIRVLTRVFGISKNPRDKKANAHLWDLAQQLVTHATRNTQHVSPCSHLNQSLMELGALICTPRNPKCPVCPISKHCFAFQNNRISDFPNLDKRPAATARRFAAFVIEHRGKFLVRQRPTGVVNAHLWEFPNIELNGAPSHAAAAAQELFGFAPKKLKSLCTIKHTITRYRITVDAYCTGAPGTDSTRPNGVAASRQSAANLFSNESRFSTHRWLPLSELHKLSFPSAHKKILNALQVTAS
jgi:A/G-specific adenine glycosylase